MNRATSFEEGNRKVFTAVILQVKIGGMSCSFCTETIRQAFDRMQGVEEVHISLSHEEGMSSSSSGPEAGGIGLDPGPLSE